MKKFFISITAAFLFMPAVAKADDYPVPKFKIGALLCNVERCGKIVQIIDNYGNYSYCFLFNNGASLNIWEKDLLNKNLNEGWGPGCADYLLMEGLSYSNPAKFWRERNYE